MKGFIIQVSVIRIETTFVWKYECCIQTTNTTCACTKIYENW